MARIYTQNDSLQEVLDFMESIDRASCIESVVYLRALGDITLGQWIEHVEANTETFLPEWVAYSIVVFPKFFNAYLMNRLIAMSRADPRVAKMVGDAQRSKKGAMEIEDNG